MSTKRNRVLAGVGAALLISACGSTSTTTTTAPSGTASVTTATTHRRPRESASLRRLIDAGGPTSAQLAYIARVCTVQPRGKPVHAWLDAEWGGKSITAVAQTLSRSFPGHANASQRSVLVNSCVARILNTSS